MKKYPIILHAGDIHIFNGKRFDEHDQVINELEKTIIQEKVDIVYLGGDIVHNKNILSPEQVLKGRELISRIVKLANIIIIPGNHDLLVKNPNRLDSISVLIDGIPTDKYSIHYLKASTIYPLYNINWAVWSCYDNKDPFKQTVELKDYYTIGCFHGAINGAITENNFGLESPITVEHFKNCQTVFLNDIHKRQYFRGGDIAYSGSILQVNADEELEKGVLIWEFDEEVNKYVSRFKEFKKDKGYVNINVRKIEEFDLNSLKIVPLGHVGRVTYTGKKTDYSAKEFNDFKKTLEKKLNIKFEKRYKPFREKPVLAQLKDKLAQNDNVKIDPFERYCEIKGFSTSFVEQLKEIDFNYNKTLGLKETSGDYEIIDLTIHNFMAYGPNNYINWKELKGITGFFGPNKIGKTSIFEALLFVCFNSISREVDSLAELINDSVKTNAYVQTIIKIRGELWKIKRSITATKKSASLSLEVWKQNSEGEWEDKKLESRPKTDKDVLLPLIGTKEAFMTIVLYSQRSPAEFVNNKQGARLDLILEFKGLSSFQLKHAAIKEDIKTIKSECNVLNDDIISLEKSLERQLESIKEGEPLDIRIATFLSLTKFAKEKKQEEITLLENEISNLNKELISLAESKGKLSVIDIDANFEYAGSLKEKKNLYKRIAEEKNILKLHKSQHKIDLTKDFSEEKNVLKVEQGILKASLLSLRGSLKTTEALLKTEDVVCNHCDQVFPFDKEPVLKEIELTKKQIKEKEERDVEILNKLKEIETQEALIEERESKIQLIEDLSAELQEIEKNIDLYEQNKKNLLAREEIIVKETSIDSAILTKTTKKKELTSSYSNLEAEEKLVNQIVNQIENKKVLKDAKEEKLTVYNLYKDMTHRTGLPLLILQEDLDLINYELGELLDDLFDFNVAFELEEDKLNIVFYYEEDKKRNASLSSGMESFIINLSIRVALSITSTQPKPSLLMIDEGFGALDSEHLEKAKILITRFKKIFENVIVISHLPELQQIPDHVLNFRVLNGTTIFEQQKNISI